jgi:hypothetical protein
LYPLRPSSLLKLACCLHGHLQNLLLLTSLQSGDFRSAVRAPSCLKLVCFRYCPLSCQISPLQSYVVLAARAQPLLSCAFASFRAPAPRPTRYSTGGRLLSRNVFLSSCQLMQYMPITSSNIRSHPHELFKYHGHTC